MVGPWTTAEIDAARGLPLIAALSGIGAFYKEDPDYTPLDPAVHSKRVQINFRGRDFRLILTGEKFVNELLPRGDPHRGGGGAIDFVRHITGLNFVQAVKLCLEIKESCRVER